MSSRLKTFLGRTVPLPVLVVAMLATIGAAGLGGAVLAQNTSAAQATPEGRAAIEAIVREYILANPEIIPEAMTRLQSREASRLLASNRTEIETPFEGAWTGNESGDVTLVVFSDYACPYCKKGAQDVAKLASEDKNLRIVFRDFPVLSPASEEAAMAALSAARQGKYVAFHDAMFEGKGKLTHERIIETVRDTGLNERKTALALVAPDLQAEVRKNLELGRALGLTGTPSYIIGDRVLSGAVGYDALKSAITEARTANQKQSG
jgi:protein-disulfide isomerase